MSRIVKITNPHAWELRWAREDHARLTNQPLKERPYWYEDIQTGALYHDLIGCVGWPTEVTDNDMGMPGYLGVVAIVKDNMAGLVEDSKFRLLAEYESYDIPSLLRQICNLRSEFGFGLHPGLLQGWYGDPTRFVTTVALFNERLAADEPEKAVLIIPPDDFSEQHAFDHYVRSLRSTITPGGKRFYFGECDLVKSKLQEFRRDDPAVMAIGGLVHTLLLRCTWMDQARENAFTVED